MSQTSLSSQESYFEFHHVDGISGLLHETFKLRFQVFCNERQFLTPEDYPEQSERDGYDPFSEHFAVFDRAGQIAGSARLVSGGHEHGYPYQTHCPVYAGHDLPPDGEAREISRLVVSKLYRRRQEDNIYGLNEQDVPPPPEFANKRGKHPIIVLGLYRAMYAQSRRLGVRYWYAAMERSLARLLNRYGFDFVQIGPEVDYYGPVAIYLADLRSLEVRVSAENPELFEWFCR